MEDTHAAITAFVHRLAILEADHVTKQELRDIVRQLSAQQAATGQLQAITATILAECQAASAAAVQAATHAMGGHASGGPPGLASNGDGFKARDLLPERWAGTEVPFAEFQFAMEVYCTALHADAPAWLTMVGTWDQYEKAYAANAGVDMDVWDKIGRDLYIALARSTTGRPNLLVRGTLSRDGWESWHKLFRTWDPRCTLDRHAAYARAATPGRRATSERELREMLPAWEQ